jgi:hypothetical protein
MTFPTSDANYDKEIQMDFITALNVLLYACLAILGLALIGYLVWFICYLIGKRQQRRRWDERYEIQLKVEKALDAHKEKLNQEEAAASERIAAANTELVSKRQQLAKRENELKDEERRVVTSIQHAKSMTNDLPAGGGFEAVSKHLRDRHMKELLFGEFITAQLIGSIDGFVGIRWKLNWDRPTPLKVVLLRGTSIVKTSWSFEDEYGDHIEPGSRYTYTLRTFDEYDRARGGDLVVQVCVPSFDVWQTDVASIVKKKPATDSNKQLRQAFKKQLSELKMTHKLARKTLVEIDGWNADDDTKEWARSQIDALTARLNRAASDVRESRY